MDRYITDKGDIVLDNGILVSKYREPSAPKGPKDTKGYWKLVGYIAPGEKIIMNKDLSDEFQLGCRLLFLDMDEELLSFRMSSSGKYKITEKPLQHYLSSPVKEMKKDEGAAPPTQTETTGTPPPAPPETSS